jgi:hypothetical protein
MSETLFPPATPKLAICVFGCITVPKYAMQIMRIQNTWGKRAEEKWGVPVYYFLGEERVPGISENPDGLIHPTTRFVYLPGVKNNYESASHKQSMGIKYIMDHHPEIEFVYTCGTDTYVNIDRMLHFLQFFDPNEKLYIGGHNNGTKLPREMVDCEDHVETPFFFGGAGFILTKAMLLALYPLLLTMTQNWVQTVIKLGRKELDSACDVMIAYHVRKLGGKYIQYYHRFYECNHIGQLDLQHLFDYNRYYECCDRHIEAKNIITCHHMRDRPDEFAHFTRILEINNWFMDGRHSTNL